MSEKGPARVAAILVGHGERGGEGRNAALLGHRSAVASAIPQVRVLAGVLSGEPAIEDALREAGGSADRILIFPFFMSDGYFVSSVIPKRASACGLEGRCEVLTPLGLDPELPGLLMRDALAAAQGSGFDPRASRLIVAAHGSKGSRASANAANLVAAQLRMMGRFAEVSAAFLEEPPGVLEQLSGSGSPAVVVGLFSGEGLHAAEDVPEAIREARVPAVYTGAIGATSGIDALIAASITEKLRAI